MTIKFPQQKAKPAKRERIADRPPEEDPNDDDLYEIRRQLGFDLLPFNGGDREVQD